MPVSVPLRSLKVTLSVKGDICDETVKRFCKWASKATMYHVVEEFTNDRRHVHALLCYEKAVLAASVQENVYKRFVKPFHPDSIGKFAVKVNANYDNKWITSYLSKETSTKVIVSQYDACREADYYPPKEVQLLLQNVNNCHTAVDSFYAEHEVEYLQYIRLRDGSTPELAIKYLYDRMHVSRTMRVISDKRRLHQIAFALDRHVRKSDVLDFEDRKACASLHGPVMDFRG